jgi:hypothetical protein
MTRTHARIGATPIGLVALALAGCRLATLPPASSRSDGGPVAARGVVSHEARSQLRLYRDAAGCEAVQALNRHFRLVTLVDDGGPRHIVLEEAWDVRHCLDSESTSSEAEITAWLPASDQTQPLFRIQARGSAGAPEGNLYRMTSRACCGGADLSAYYSLLTGRALFSSSIPPLRVEDPTSGEMRVVAFHDTYSAGSPPEAIADSTVVGVLQIGDEREPAARFAVVADRPGPHAVAELALVRDGAAVDRPATVDPSRRPLHVRVGLVARLTGRRATLVVPVTGLELDVGRARTTGGVSLRTRP